MKEEAKIWAAHAAGETSFAISMGVLDADPSRSVIAVYSESDVARWNSLEVDSTIMSITHQGASSARPTYVALGIDGFVFFVDGSMRREHLLGADFDEENDEVAPMSTVKCEDGELIACGYESQVYVRRSERWEVECDIDTPGVGDNSFESVAASGSRLAVCGSTAIRHRTPTADEQALLERMENDDSVSMKELLQKKEELEAVERYPAGCLFIRRRNWDELDVATDQTLNDVIFLTSDRVIAVGDAGTILAAFSDDSVEDLSDRVPREQLKAIRHSNGLVYILGQRNISILNEDLSEFDSIAIPPEFRAPLSIDVYGETIWLFDYYGVARHARGAWQTIEIPVGLRNSAGDR